MALLTHVTVLLVSTFLMHGEMMYLDSCHDALIAGFELLHL
ncbi:hypothetical protein [Shewanella youngdeokensis]|uniref:Uncharacterized protein n=1 Tax=Shewanella youngdeokensis TaxID=2999068 RepID=A0ABZ0K1X8_9GAMM|nr:hypothetical protein RGE70_04705 [Shewanella sp. DAU334]